MLASEFLLQRLHASPNYRPHAAQHLHVPTRPTPQGIIGSTFFQRVQQIIYHPENLPGILGAALPNASNFFIQFISMRALFLVWLRMCVPHGGVWQNWCHYLCCPPRCCSFCNTGGYTLFGSQFRGPPPELQNHLVLCILLS